MSFAWTIGTSPKHWHGFRGSGVVGAFGSMVVVTGGSLQVGQGSGFSNPIPLSPSLAVLHLSLNSSSVESPINKKRNGI